MLVERATVDDPVAAQLITELNAEIMATHAEGTTSGASRAEDVAPGRGAFLVLALDGEPWGVARCASSRDDEAELKRMYVRPSARGRKLGAVLVDSLEAEARALGVTRFCSRQPSTSGPRCACTNAQGSRRSSSTASTSAASDSYCMGKTLT